MDLLSVIKLLGGVALFLFGMSLMGDSLKKVAGSKLELFLFKLTSNPLKGILLGTIVTAVIQSSSATSAMVVGFVNSGMMNVRQAIGVIMGAIIGTSITGWIISLSYIGSGASGLLKLLSTSSLAAMIGVVGIVLIMGSKKRKVKNIGEILMGFAVLMVGMEQMSASVSGLRSDPSFLALFTSFTNPFVGILVGAGFTAIIQSASAAVGIIQALSTTGVISFAMSLPVIMGVAIGAAVPVIISSVGASSAAKRSAWSYLVIDVLGIVGFSLLFYGANLLVSIPYLAMIMNPISIAMQNTIFRVVIIVLLAPFIWFIEKIVNLMVRDDKDLENELLEINKLEERFLQYPPLAIENVTNAINSMADKVLNILFSAIELLNNYSEKDFDGIEEKENVIDEYEDKINIYLTKMASFSLNTFQSQTVTRFLRSVADLERISDHAFNIAQCAQKMHEKNDNFTSDGNKELKVLFSALQECLTTSIDCFISNSKDLAYQVEPLEEVIDILCDQMKNNHIQRLQEGVCNVENGYVFNDLLTDIERVSDHCSNIAIFTIGMENKNFDGHGYEQNVVNELKFKQYLEHYKDKYQL